MINKKYAVITYVLFLLLITLSGVFALQMYAPYPTKYYGEDLSKYIPGFSPDMCEGGADFLVQVDPIQGCSPRVIRSDLLEENSVPVFCPLQAIKINPLLDVPYIKSITLRGEKPREIAALTFYPARAALSQNTELIGSPTISNIGYLVAILQKQPTEKNMSDWVVANVTAHIEYDAIKTYGIGYKDIVSNEIKDDVTWQSDYKKYGFWNGKGYLRLSDVEEDSARVDIYSDVNNKIASYIMKPGQVEKGYLPGLYCAAGYEVKLNSLRLPGTKAKLVIDSDEAIVGKGSKILDGKCEVYDITEDTFGAGQVKLRCPDKTYYLTINRPSALLATKEKTQDMPKDTDYNSYKTGEKVFSNSDKKIYIYLAYVGESPDKKEFVIVIKRSTGQEISESELNAITNIIEKVFNKRVSVLRTVTDALKQITIDNRKELEDTLKFGEESYRQQYSAEGLKKVIESDQQNFIRKLLKDPAATIKLITKDSSEIIGDYKVFFKGIKGIDDQENEVEIDKATQTYYDKAVGEYKEVANAFPGEKNLLGDFYGAIALEKAAKLAGELGKNKERKELLESIVEKYPNTPQAEKARDQIQLSVGYDMNKAFSEIKIRDKSHYVRVDSIEPASVEDYGVELIVGDKGEGVMYGLGDYINNPEKKKISVSKIEEDKVTFLYEYEQTTKEVLSKDYVMKIGQLESIGGVKIYVKQIKMNREAHITVSPVMRGGSMDANFTFKIAIEKRAIKLSPEKTKELINSLNSSIAQWEKTVKDLGNLVQTWNKMCLVTAVGLQIKAFINNLGGGSIARTEVMEKWRKYCDATFGADKRSKCYAQYESQIKADMEKKKAEIKQTNEIVQQCEDKAKAEGAIDYNKFYSNCISEMAKIKGNDGKHYRSVTFSQYEMDKLKEDYGNKEFIYIDEQGVEHRGMINDLDATYDGRTIYINDETVTSDKALMDETNIAKLRDKYLFTSDVKDVISDRLTLEKCRQSNHGGYSAQFCLDFENKFYDTMKTYEKGIEEVKDQLDITELAKKNKGLALQYFPDIIKQNIKENPVYTAREDIIDSEGKILVKKGERYTGYRISGIGSVLSVVEKSGVDNYIPIKDRSYVSEGNEFKESKKLDTKSLSENVREELDRLVIKGKGYEICRGKFLDTELKVKYFETEPYKGLPAIVPFDKEGWYVAIPPYRVIGTQASSAYDQSALLKNFWICNAGENGRIEFMNSPSGDDADCCTQYREGMPTTGWTIGDLTEAESQAKLRAAVSAVDTAANAYGQKTVRIGDMTLTSAVQAITSQADCEDFMNPSDCNWLFNVCDPVLCPTSRCNLGGNYYVDDVVQSGIIGSIALCLPNFGSPSEGGVLVPICLTGIHAGLDNLVTILKASRDCLQESLTSGKNVGICDEIKSVYLCEFFWREFTPLLKAGIPALVNMVTKKSTGGGEYLIFNDAWDKSTKSVQYFTNYYGLNAFKAFRARTTSEIGSDVCRAFISQSYPTSEFLDQLTEPESPVQFSAWFDEIPLTTVTLPPRSQYKVYYHIYAGKDEGANYYVYLKREPGTSLYGAQTEQVFVDSGFIPKGEFVDKAPDIMAPSGIQKLCVRINFKEECGFGKVSTSFAIDWLTQKYLADQATNDVKNEEECMGGTPSINPMILTPNIEAGVTESLQPDLLQQGITRICSGSDPSASTEPGRWKAIGYCDDAKKIRCWLDTNSVKQVITDKGLLNATLEDAENKMKKEIGALGLMGDEEAQAKLKQLEDGLTTLSEKVEKIVKNTAKDDLVEAIDKEIDSVVSGFKEITERAYHNTYKARANYGLASLYENIARKVDTYLKEKAAAEKAKTEEEKKQGGQQLIGERYDINLDTMNEITVVFYEGEEKTILFDGKSYTVSANFNDLFSKDRTSLSLDSSISFQSVNNKLNYNLDGSGGNDVEVTWVGLSRVSEFSEELKQKYGDAYIGQKPHMEFKFTRINKIQEKECNDCNGLFKSCTMEECHNMGECYANYVSAFTGGHYECIDCWDKKIITGYDLSCSDFNTPEECEHNECGVLNCVWLNGECQLMREGLTQKTSTAADCAKCSEGLDLICGSEECHKLGNCYIVSHTIGTDECIACTTKTQCTDLNNQDECTSNKCGLSSCIWSTKGCIVKPAASSSDEKKNK